MCSLWPVFPPLFPSAARKDARCRFFGDDRAVVCDDKSSTVASLVGTKCPYNCHLSHGWHSKGSCGRRMQSAFNERVPASHTGRRLCLGAGERKPRRADGFLSKKRSLVRDVLPISLSAARVCIFASCDNDNLSSSEVKCDRFATGNFTGSLTLLETLSCSAVYSRYCC